MMDGDGTISEKARNVIQDKIEGIIGGEMGFICVVFDTKTGRADVFSNASSRTMVIHLLSAAISVVEGSSEGERVGVLH